MDKEKLAQTKLELHWERQYQLEGNGRAVADAFLPMFTQLDKDFQKFINRVNSRFLKVLDVGTGTGEQAFALAETGLDVTAIDISATAIAQAKGQLGRKDLSLQFLSLDFLKMSSEMTFDLIFNCGCFTLLPPSLKKGYHNKLNMVLQTNGWFCLKSYFTKGVAAFREVLSEDFVCEHLYESAYEAQQQDEVRKAWFSVWQKK